MLLVVRLDSVHSFPNSCQLIKKVEMRMTSIKSNNIVLQIYLCDLIGPPSHYENLHVLVMLKQVRTGARKHRHLKI